ncbi:MAG: acyltransferase family protein [Planctomycetota bacterium]
MSDIKYRPEIDGLRAVSVVLVVLFHADHVIPGGYVGVDVFFVISGFLITSIIRRQIEQGQFRLRDFWVRRIRRILPASAVCIVGTLLLCSVVMLPNKLMMTARSAAASSLGVANVYFMEAGGYFDGPADEKPLVHFWSLAVEEQFYLFFPPLLVWLHRRRRDSVLRWLVGLTVASLACSAFAVYRKPDVAFYLLPSRAWELLLGALLVVIPRRDVGPSRCEWTSSIGLAMIVAAAVFFDPLTPFPGFAALVPCWGAACVIRANQSARLTVIGRLLACRPMVFVGRISYSLYLWHWPILALMRYCLIEITLVNGMIAVFVSLALAYLSWRWIEQPFRKIGSAKQSETATWKPFALGGACVIGILLLSSGIVVGNGWRWRYRASVSPHVEDATWNAAHLKTSRGAKDYPRIGDANCLEDSFVVWGDSHAMMISDVLDRSAEEAGIAGRFISVGGVPPLRHVWQHGGRTPPSTEADRIVQYIQDQHVPNVILAARWSAYAEGYGSGDMRFDERGKHPNHFVIGDSKDDDFVPTSARRVLRERLADLVVTLTSTGTRVWIVQQVPEQLGPTALPLLLQKHIHLKSSFFPTNVMRHRQRQAAANSALRMSESLGATLIQTQHLFFDEYSRPILFVDGRACYNDNDHLTRYGAARMLHDPLSAMAADIASSL